MKMKQIQDTNVKPMRKDMKPSLLICFALLLTGCISMDIAHFSVISTKPIDMRKDYVSSKKITGTDMAHHVIIFPIGTPKIDTAVENALITSGADYLTDVRVTSDLWLIPLIYGQLSINVEGTAWKTQN